MRPLCILASVLLAAAAAAGGESAHLTVPGERIGPVRIGDPESAASRHNLAVLRGEPGCPVHFRSDNGTITVLSTDTGGPCPTAGGTQPGVPLLVAIAELGRDRRTVPAESYPTGQASWHVWDAVGFAARAVLPKNSRYPGEAVITCIAVFAPGRAFRPGRCDRP
jgi:hypothetical protein